MEQLERRVTYLEQRTREEWRLRELLHVIRERASVAAHILTGHVATNAEIDALREHIAAILNLATIEEAP